MIQENELIMLILGIGVLVFFFVCRKRIRGLPGWRTFLLAYVVLLAGWVLTVLEGLIWPETLNLFEHICYAVSSIFLCIWCWQVFWRREATVR